MPDTDDGWRPGAPGFPDIVAMARAAQHDDRNHCGAPAAIEISSPYAAELARQVDELEAENAALRSAAAKCTCRYGLAGTHATDCPAHPSAAPAATPLQEALELIIEMDTSVSNGGKTHDHGQYAEIAIAALAVSRPHSKEG